MTAKMDELYEPTPSEVEGSLQIINSSFDDFKSGNKRGMTLFYVVYYSFAEKAFTIYDVEAVK